MTNPTPLTTEELWSTYMTQILLASAATAVRGRTTMTPDEVEYIIDTALSRAVGLLMALGYDSAEASRTVDEAYAVRVARTEARLAITDNDNPSLD